MDTLRGFHRLPEDAQRSIARDVYLHTIVTRFLNTNRRLLSHWIHGNARQAWVDHHNPQLRPQESQIVAAVRAHFAPCAEDAINRRTSIVQSARARDIIAGADRARWHEAHHRPAEGRLESALAPHDQRISDCARHAVQAAAHAHAHAHGAADPALANHARHFLRASGPLGRDPAARADVTGGLGIDRRLRELTWLRPETPAADVRHDLAYAAGWVAPGLVRQMHYTRADAMSRAAQVLCQRVQPGAARVDRDPVAGAQWVEGLPTTIEELAVFRVVGLYARAVYPHVIPARAIGRLGRADQGGPAWVHRAPLRDPELPPLPPVLARDVAERRGHGQRDYGE